MEDAMTVNEKKGIFGIFDGENVIPKYHLIEFNLVRQREIKKIVIGIYEPFFGGLVLGQTKTCVFPNIRRCHQPFFRSGGRI